MADGVLERGMQKDLLALLAVMTDGESSRRAAKLIRLVDALGEKDGDHYTIFNLYYLLTEEDIQRIIRWNEQPPKNIVNTTIAVLEEMHREQAPEQPH